MGETAAERDFVGVPPASALDRVGPAEKFLMIEEGGEPVPRQGQYSSQKTGKLAK